MKILANDGLAAAAIARLQEAGFEVITTKVAQEQVANFINEHQIDALLVRSATQVRRDLIDACPSLKVIGRGGVGLDNIDVAYAREKGLQVINTPASSSHSVAELVIAHLFTGVRFLHDSNRNMPLEGDQQFNNLKKAYAKGIELKGKTLGIIGFGRIGQAVARMAIGLGMNVLAYDKFLEKATVQLEFFNGQKVDFEIAISPFETVLKESDFVTLHVPAQDGYVIDEAQMAMMKKGAALINASRGGVVNEVALLAALDEGHLAFAGLDVFEEEPTPAIQVLMHPAITMTPHIGAATVEAQDRIGFELADQLIQLLQIN